MKRSEALLDLSREHHAALSLAVRAKRVVGEGQVAVAAMAALVSERFRRELKPHFDAEEAWLLPALQQAGDSDLVHRTLAEHAELVGLVARLAAPDAETLYCFAERLSSHVRFEERELFPVAERHPGCLAGYRSHFD
jgi:iron-sulfur cluster repair protein YtfE (RIC family)